jgi:HSP20 family protein
MDKRTETSKGQQVQKPASTTDMGVYDDFDRMFDNFFTRGWMRPWRQEWPAFGELNHMFGGRHPHVDVIDRDGEVVVKAELPGVNKKDLDISMTEDSVTIKGITRHEEKEEKENYYRSEISRGEFARTVALPAEVDSDKARASFKDGILELVLPKTRARKRRSIAVE